MENNYPIINRDLSWLSFNYRVLQEAKDPRVPLMERIKFLAIYSSNLDEFFRVRVANHRNLVRLGKKTKKKLAMDPAEILKKIQQTVSEQQQEFGRIFRQEITPELRKYKIHMLRRADLSSEQQEYIETFFQDNLLPYVQPVLLEKAKVRPFLNNAALYLTLQMREKGMPNAPERFAVVKIPSDHIDRFIELPSAPGQHDLMILDDIVRHSATWLFPGYDILDEFSIKLTRDAELYIDDEFSGNLILKIRKSLKKRSVGPASRLVYDQEIPQHMLEYLMDVLEVEDYDLLPEGRYHNNFDFFGFPDFGLEHLKNVPLPPQPYFPLEDTEDFWGAIREKDHLIHVPYHNYESVIRFFEEAATDPQVTHIKIVQYRVAKVSRIMNALIRAVNAGKQVFAFIEVKARFDEEANLDWGEKLEAAGVTVRYSFPGLKVHSKMAMVRRMEDGEPHFYTYLSTGNFHEGTAKLYSDFGLFTSENNLTTEVVRLFSHLEMVQLKEDAFSEMLVGQFNLREGLVACIDEEIKNAKAGEPAEITLKMNSLQDEAMNIKLYEASQAGVSIHLNIRGICTISAGQKEISENIEAFSIVDRFLEHSRIFVFHNGGNTKIYLSSADWMTRNLSYRIETCFPIQDPRMQKHILEFLQIQSQDNFKSRSLHVDKLNEYRTNISDLAVRAQHEYYFYIKRKNERYLQNLTEAKQTEEIDSTEQQA